MYKVFDANAESNELATFLNKRGFRLDTVSMFITEGGFCGVETKARKVKTDRYDEDTTARLKEYRRIQVFMLIDGESEGINELYEKQDDKEVRIISQISKGTEEGHLVMIDYVEKLY